MQSIDSVAEALSEVIRLIAECPEAASVTVVPESAQRVLLRVTVDPRDTGKVIGRQGRTARALRVILENMTNTLDHRVGLDIET